MKKRGKRSNMCGLVGKGRVQRMVGGEKSEAGGAKGLGKRVEEGG